MSQEVLAVRGEIHLAKRMLPNCQLTNSANIGLSHRKSSDLALRISCLHLYIQLLGSCLSYCKILNLCKKKHFLRGQSRDLMSPLAKFVSCLVTDFQMQLLYADQPISTVSGQS